MSVRISKPPVNIREKLAELERPIGVNGSALMKTETPQEAFSLIGAGRKNLIINGDFSVSQRGNYTSSTPMVSNVYYLDRWVSDVVGVNATFRQITTDLPKQYRNLTNTGLRFEATSSSSNAYMGFRQKYEFMSGLDGKYVTVSAWVKSNRQAVLTNYDGSGAPFDYAQHSGSGGWEYLSYTTYISSTSYNLFDIWLIDPITYGYTPINSGDYVEVTNYQVEVGKVATEFDHRPYAEELALCQRYYQEIGKGSSTNDFIASGFVDSSGADFYGGGFLKVPMRTTPVVSFTGTIGHFDYTHPSFSTTANSIASYWANPNSYVIRLTSLSTGGTTGYGAYARITTSSTALTFNAEL